MENITLIFLSESDLFCSTKWSPDPYTSDKRKFEDRIKLGHGAGEMILDCFSHPNVTIRVLTSEKAAQRDW